MITARPPTEVDPTVLTGKRLPMYIQVYLAREKRVGEPSKVLSMYGSA